MTPVPGEEQLTGLRSGQDRRHIVECEPTQILGSVDVAKEVLVGRHDRTLREAGKTPAKRPNALGVSSCEHRNDPLRNSKRMPLPTSAHQRHRQFSIT